MENKSDYRIASYELRVLPSFINYSFPPSQNQSIYESNGAIKGNFDQNF